MPEGWSLAGKVALITSDGRGGTPHLASALAEAGADVAVAGAAGSAMPQATAAVEGQGRRALAIEADLTRRGDGASAVRAAQRAGGNFSAAALRAAFRTDTGAAPADAEGVIWIDELGVY